MSEQEEMLVSNVTFPSPADQWIPIQNDISWNDIFFSVFYSDINPSFLVHSMNTYASFILTILVVLVSLGFFMYKQHQNQCRGICETRRVLIVTAHPDDECMFFGPLIINMSKTADVHLVCLSVGDYYGIGSRRKQELWNSCQVLGINPNNIQLIKHDLLPDSPKVDWGPELVASVIAHYIETLGVDTVISFDQYGVSGHRNHKAIYKALVLLSRVEGFPVPCTFYVLRSVNIFFKYLGFLNVFLYYKCSRFYSCSYSDHKVIQKAMAKHESQNVWFRKVFMMCSSYSYVNTFKSIKS